MPLKDPIARIVWQKQYNKDHREERQAYDKQYNKDHCEERLVYKKQYYKDNREERLVQQKQYSKDHPEVKLRSQKKTFTELGKVFDLDYNPMRYAIDAWSKTVRKRDGHKCTWCDSTQNLIAHHIWHKAFCPESSLDVNNGITLCHDCHWEQHKHDRSFS